MRGSWLGDMVRVDSLLGGRKVTEKMKKNIRSKWKIIREAAA